MKKIIMVGDVHAPHHDVEAVELALKCISAFQPDYLVMMGDFCDAFSISSHSKAPSRKTSLKAEMDICKNLLSRFSNSVSKKCKRVYLFGNHCQRLDRYIADKAPELDGLLSVGDMIGLDQDGWISVPYKRSIKIGELVLTHDLGTAGPKAAMDAVRTYGTNVAIGHVHSANICYSGQLDGKNHVAISTGWLGSYESADYMPLDKALVSWTHGIAFGYLLDDSSVHVNFAPFVNGRAVIGGQEIRYKPAAKGRKLRSI